MLFAEIIEIAQKLKNPIGPLGKNASGEKHEVNENDYGEKSYRAILDIGLLDISIDYLIPEDNTLSIIGASSDMLVVDMRTSYDKYKVGQLIEYMGALGVLNSNYIEKK